MADSFPASKAARQRSLNNVSNAENLGTGHRADTIPKLREILSVVQTATLACGFEARCAYETYVNRTRKVVG
jgi:hypothetical protein